RVLNAEDGEQSHAVMYFAKVGKAWIVFRCRAFWGPRVEITISRADGSEGLASIRRNGLFQSLVMRACKLNCGPLPRTNVRGNPGTLFEYNLGGSLDVCPELSARQLDNRRHELLRRVEWHLLYNDGVFPFFLHWPST
ncbi:hypothetical protein IL306_009491, partial [Fusarium sp. DS 682]